MAKNREKYAHPDLREEIKEEIKAPDKGGRPGQWSARKSQLLTQEYEKRGGGYKGEYVSCQVCKSGRGVPHLCAPHRANNCGCSTSISSFRSNFARDPALK